MATSQDIDAVTDYIEAARPLIPQHAGLLGNNPLEKVISDYEAWLGNLTWYGRYIDTNDSFKNAKWYRDEVNRILDRKLPDDYLPADAAKAAETAGIKPSWWSKLPATTQWGVAGSAALIVAAGVFAAPMYITAFAKRKMFLK
jgi:hypothetical protein